METTEINPHPIHKFYGTTLVGILCFSRKTTHDNSWKEKKTQISNNYLSIKGKKPKNFHIPLGRFRYECVTGELVPKDTNVCFENPKLPDEDKYNFSNLVLRKRGKTAENVQNRTQQGNTQGKTIVEFDEDDKCVAEFGSLRKLIQSLYVKNRHVIVKKLNSEGGKGIYVNQTRRFAWVPDPDLEGEIWKTIFISKDGEIFATAERNNAKYYVSNEGRIHRDNTNKWYGTSQPNGYMVVKVLGKTFFIHKLVATAFLGVAPKEKMTVNHKDKNPQNNRIENLEWMTQSEQNLHGVGKYYKLTHKDSNEMHTFFGMNDASDFLRNQGATNNENASTLSTALTRCKKRKTYIGKVWYPECMSQEEYEKSKKRKIE